MDDFSSTAPVGARAALWCQNDQDLVTLINGLQISPKSRNQFRRAMESPSTALLDHVLLPELWNASDPNPDNHSYVCVSDVANVPGRNHRLAEGIATKFDLDDVLGAALFTNRLLVDYGNYADDPGGWSPPSSRVLAGGPVIFTIEFDVADVAFFERQMAWCRSNRNPVDAPVGAIYQHYSRFNDFLGLTVVWSAHKSLHLHLTFDSALIANLMSPDPSRIRRGFQAHWDEIAARVCQILEIPDGIEPDRMLRHPEMFRRLPWGRREITKPHLLGIQVGTVVPQVVLWEMWRGRAANGVTDLFFRPDWFALPPEKKRETMAFGLGGKPSCGPLAEEDRHYCQRRLDEEVRRQVNVSGAAGPVLYRLEFVGGNWVALFANSPSDSNPSSIMRADHCRVLLCGRDASSAARVHLEYPLAVMMKLWQEQRDRQAASRTEVVEFDVIRSRPLSDIEREFQDTVIDKATAMAMTRKSVAKILREHERAIIKGPEGSGKTTAVFGIFHRLMKRYAGRVGIDGKLGAEYAMFAFSNYQMAAKKAEQFNNTQERHGYCAILIHSFEREYQAVCDELRVKALTTEDALKAGYDHLYGMIARQQSAVMERMKERHRAVWAEIGTSKAVFFTVHGVAEQWAKWSFTRLWWHKAFPSQFRQKTPAEMKWEMRLALLVYDEVSVGTFIDWCRAEVVEWVDQLRQAMPSWRSPKGKAKDRLREFRAHIQTVGNPTFGGNPSVLSFQDALSIRDLPKRHRESVKIRNSGEYARDDAAGERDIYAEVAGRHWCVHPRSWWNGVADKVLVLTTEILPSLVAERLGWALVELECPKVQQSLIQVHLDRSVSATNVGKVINRFREKRRDQITVISNKASHLPETVTHHGAKGDNDFIGLDVAQTMLHVAPAEYEELEVINAWAGIDSAVRLRHVDELNQSAGRNLGFRWDGKAEHHLLISYSLYLKLGDVLFENSRYGFRLTTSSGKKYEVRRKAG